MPEKIICAAVQMDDGYIVYGHRHHNALQAANDIPKYAGTVASNRPQQGFVTSEGRFVDRREAYKIVFGRGEKDLYSDDLY